MDVETVLGTTNLNTDNIIYNAFHQTVHFTGCKTNFLTFVSDNSIPGLDQRRPVMQPMEIASLFLSMFRVNRWIKSVFSCDSD